MAVRPLRERLSPSVPLRFPGFERHYELGTANAYAFERMDCRDWYHEMRARLSDAIVSRNYLPLYRMGDGEYVFALGGRPGDRLPLWKLGPRRLAGRLLKRLLRRNLHRSGSAEYGWEQYSARERAELQGRYVDHLRMIADRGILALALHDRPLYQRYIPDILDWFDARGVLLHRYNYYHVYSVYALLHGPDRFSLLQGRRLLVVTGLTDEKRRGIEAGLEAIGVADMQFLPISSSKAMLEKIDLRSVRGEVDVVLVGAGVGSANILVQLEPLQTVCLDVGFVLSTLANPDLRWNRPFCVPDEAFDPAKVRWLPRR